MVELAYRAAGTGLPLVLLHAFPLSSAMWLPQREVLGASYRVITPDQRGFGGSELGPDGPDLDRCVDDVVGLLDRLDLDRVVLGGLSMGGYVAMAFLRRYANRVQGLILADTKATADPQAVRDNRERIAGAVQQEGSTVLLDEVLPTLLGTTTTQSRADVVGRVRGLLQAAPAPAVAWAQRAMAARPDSFDTLRAYAGPSLVVVGEEDTLSPPSDAAAMAAALQHGRLVTLAAAGHLTAIETPQAFNDAVLDFVGELD